jgi:hypothetical protein
MFISVPVNDRSRETIFNLKIDDFVYGTVSNSIAFPESWSIQMIDSVDSNPIAAINETWNDAKKLAIKWTQALHAKQENKKTGVTNE